MRVRDPVRVRRNPVQVRRSPVRVRRNPVRVTSPVRVKRKAQKMPRTYESANALLRRPLVLRLHRLHHPRPHPHHLQTPPVQVQSQ
jgi:hypothetical protein